MSRNCALLNLPGRADAKLCAYAARRWRPIHCSQSCNDLTVFAVGSMCAEKENPKAGRSLQSFSLRLNVVQKPATTSLEMKRICCSSWACTCRRFICALKDSFYWREVYPQGNAVDFLFASSAMVKEDCWTISALVFQPSPPISVCEAFVNTAQQR